MSTIKQISPDKFSIQDYTFQDYTIVPNFEVTSLFQQAEDNVEYFVYDANSNLLTENYSFSGYSFSDDPSITNLGGFSTINIDPELDLISDGYDVGQYNVVYNFFENQLSSSVENRFFIKTLSTDRTELRLATNTIQGVLESFPSFKQKLDGEDYFNEFYLNFGENQILIAINAVIYEGELLIKLYEPLPQTFTTKTTCWVVLKIADPVAYNVDLISPIEEIDSVPFLKGPNTNLQMKSEINNSTSPQSYEELVTTSLTSSFQQVSSLLDEKGIEISINYSDYNNFVHFSSAEQRLLNFYTKVQQIEAYTDELVQYNYSITGSTSSSLYVSESKATYQTKINSIIKNFDGYEYFLYYESSSYAWPKQPGTQPYTLYGSTTTQVYDWIGNSNENANVQGVIFPGGTYGGLALSASLFDNDNQNNLLNVVPGFVIEDATNEPYNLFVEMIGQHFDNIWIYLKDVTNKFDADNRLNYGISKDLVAQAIRDFGLKIYQNQFGSDDLYSSFLGITPSGSLLPYTGSELITSYITASSEVIPLDDVNKSIYKRLYHNMPYLLKKKGTIPGIKALVASYGIPNTILRVSEFGGKDRDNSNDWDYWYNQFNYAFYTSGSTYVSSSFELDSDWWGSAGKVPQAVEFRFQSDGLPTLNFSQSLWSTDTGIQLSLEYEGPGSVSGSYSGSVVDTYKDYGYLRLYPDPSNLTVSASVYLPVFDNGWWSVLINSGSTGYDLYAKNKLYIGNDATYIGFQASSSVSEVNTLWLNTTTSYFASGSNEYFSGSLQEIRYYKYALNESTFDDYVQNPRSFEGNTLNSAPLELVFRASLGGELNTGSLESIHPQITGSWIPTGSFNGGSSFSYSSTPTFTPNTEYVFLDQPAAGIRNRITDKVRIGEQILPTGSNQVLSQYISIEQDLPLSQSFTPDVNLVEAAFSPQNEINDDIIEQIGYFNLGEKIGDNRYNFYTRSTNPDYTLFTKNEEVPYRTDYEDLTRFSTEYFQKYTSNYDIYDYIRLIKYFDNSLFKMIKDFVPAKSSLSSGVVIKQHLLERSRYPHPNTTAISKLARVQGTGSAANTMVNYYVKDLALSGSTSIGSISGGAGGGPNVYNQIANNPYEQSIGTQLPFGTPVTNLTQSYTQSLDTIAGTFQTIDSTQDEFYNGEYSGSEYVVTNGELTPGCFVYLHGLPDTYSYTASIFNATASYVTEARFLDNDNCPMVDGQMFFFLPSGSTNVSYARIASIDANGNNLGSSLNNLQSFSTISDLGSKNYTVAGNTTQLGNNYLIKVGNTQGIPTITQQQQQNSEYFLRTNKINTTPYSSIWNPTSPGGGGFQEYQVESEGLSIVILPLNSKWWNNGASGQGFQLSGSFMESGYPASSGFDNFYDNVSGFIRMRNTNISQLFGIQPGVGSYNVSGRMQTLPIAFPSPTMRGRIVLYYEQNFDPSFPTYDRYLIPIVTSTAFNITNTTAPIESAFTLTSQATARGEGYFKPNWSDGLSNDAGPKYWWGFVTESSSTPAQGSLRFFSRTGGSGDEFIISISQSTSSPNFYVDALDSIIESSYPSGFQNSDCDVLQGNAVIDRVGTLYYDVDYATSATTAVNEAAILNGTAEYANVQNSNYSTLAHINPRYKGSRTTSEYVNLWTSGSVNTFGKSPTVDSKKTYFAYFDFINGTGPELNNKSIAHIQFLVDQDGNTIPPDKTKLYITQNTFQTGETVFINLDDPLRFETPMNKLNGVKQVVRGGQRVDALLYSDSGSSYSGEIQFDTGSFSVTDYQFTAGNTTGVRRIPGASDTTVYTYTTGSAGNPGFNNETQTNAQYDSSNGVFTFTSNTDSPVKFIAKIDTQFLYAVGNIYFYIVKNWSSGAPPFSNFSSRQFWR
jgi:hypothetical protein